MEILKLLNLTSLNSGASTSSSWWSTTKNAGEVVSYNPADGTKFWVK